MRRRSRFLLQALLPLVLAACGSAPQPGMATTAVPSPVAAETITAAALAPTETVEAPATITAAVAASTAAVEASATISAAIETATATAEALATITAAVETETATADALATTTSGTAESNLLAALAFAPSATSIVQFTDWQLIKSYRGVEDLTSQSPMEERQVFLSALTRDQAAASGYGIANFRTHAETWAFDTLDFVWEANFQTDGPPAYVLKLRPDFDFAAVLAHFGERGFTESSYEGTTIYSHEMDVSQEWLRQGGEFAILNTAILPDEHLMVLSSAQEAVHALLDARQGDPDPALMGTARGLGTVAAAIVGRGEEVCAGYSGTMSEERLREQGLSEEQIVRILQSTQGTAQPHAYDGIGVGYRYEEERPVGLIVFHYADTADAQADLELRRAVAEEGMSMVSGQPYREAVFTVLNGSVEGSALVLQVEPVNNQPRRLFDMFARRDMSFAGCP